MYRTVCLLSALLAAGASPVFVQAETQPEDLIKYRQNYMKSLGGHVGSAALILRGKVDYMPHLINHARALAAGSQDLEIVFPEGSDFGDTEAKASIWEKPEDFKQAADGTEQAAQAFLEAVESGERTDILRRFKALGQSCKDCHEDFRQKKE